MNKFFIEVTKETTRGFFRNTTEFVIRVWVVTTVQTRFTQNSFENCLVETRTPHLGKVQDHINNGIVLFPVEQRQEIVVLDRTDGNYGFANIIQRQKPVETVDVIKPTPVESFKEKSEIPTEITTGTVVKRTRRPRNPQEQGSTSTPPESAGTTSAVSKPDVPVPPSTSRDSSWIGDSRDIG